ncbi:hypothetical protein [Yoonia sp. BS5-3]|uniref:Autotransporter outer membrane beta-barrel domain-containing protein n=1 Tax=Yoonia phaeophyticola TaxID=3137369 RepID=A0ABZ2V6L3_9RHOB
MIDLIADGDWTGRISLSFATELANGVIFDSSVELSGLGGDQETTSGGLRFGFSF